MIWTTIKVKFVFIWYRTTIFGDVGISWTYCESVCLVVVVWAKTQENTVCCVRSNDINCLVVGFTKMKITFQNRTCRQCTCFYMFLYTDLYKLYLQLCSITNFLSLESKVYYRPFLFCFVSVNDLKMFNKNRCAYNRSKNNGVNNNQGNGPVALFFDITS